MTKGQTLKKLISSILTTIMLLICFFGINFGVEQNTALTHKVEISDGGGYDYSLKDEKPNLNKTADNYYLIRTTDDLREIEKDMTANYRLANDISFTNNTIWKAIGIYDSARKCIAFSGVFDGATHSISNLKLNETACRTDSLVGAYGGYYAYHGLFAKLNGATIKNLMIDTPSFVSKSTYELKPANSASRPKIGFVAGVTEGDKVYLQNIWVKNACIDFRGTVEKFQGASVRVEVAIGGLIGTTKSDIEINNCSVVADSAKGFVASALTFQRSGDLSGCSAGISVGGIIGVCTIYDDCDQQESSLRDHHDSSQIKYITISNCMAQLNLSVVGGYGNAVRDGRTETAMAAGIVGYCKIADLRISKSIAIVKNPSTCVYQENDKFRNDIPILQPILGGYCYDSWADFNAQDCKYYKSDLQFFYRSYKEVYSSADDVSTPDMEISDYSWFTSQAAVEFLNS